MSSNGTRHQANPSPTETPQLLEGAAKSGVLIDHLRTMVFLGLLAVEIAIQFRPFGWLKPAAGFVAFAAWLVALPAADRWSRGLALALAGAGTAFFFLAKIPPLAAVGTFSENASVLTIMILVPVLRIIIDMGGYKESLEAIARTVHDPASLFLFALFLSYAIGSVLLNAAIALVWTIMEPVVREAGKEPREFLVSCLPRGYNASLPWSPSSPAMATALGLAGVSWGSVLFPGLVLSALIFACAILVEARGSLLKPPKQKPGDFPEVAGKVSGPGTSTCPSDSIPEIFGTSFDGGARAINAGDAEPWRKVATLAFGFSAFIAAVVALGSFHLNIYQAIFTCILCTLAIWLWALGIWKQGWKQVALYFLTKVPAMSNQFLLMTTAGFIGSAIRAVAARSVLLPGLSFRLTGPWATVAVSLSVSLISVAGIHPIIGMAIVHSVLSPMVQFESARQLAMALLLGSSLGFSISPVSATVLVTSSCAGINSIQAGIKTHWKFALVSWVAGIAVLIWFF